MALAYLFWHRPRPGTDPAGYEAALAAFQQALRDDPPSGLRAAAAYRIDAAPWLPGDGPVYEDWYVVDDWASVGRLNDAAVTGTRRAAHERAAGGAGEGTAGLYRRVLGAPSHAGRQATWLSKPPGLTHADFGEELDRRLGGQDASVWQRQMVLGPAPEFCVLADAPVVPAGRDTEAIVRAPVSGG